MAAAMADNGLWSPFDPCWSYVLPSHYSPPEKPQQVQTTGNYPTAECSRASKPKVENWVRPPPASLLGLPAEIRLQIYYWVLVQHPSGGIQPKALAAWYPSPPLTSYRTRRLDAAPSASPASRSGSPSTTPPEGDTPGRGDDDEADDPTLIDPRRPHGYIPSALLLACRLIYHEARHAPFEHNEFAFPNWFSCGVSAARAFSRRLALHQLNALRHARLDLMTRNLVPGGGGVSGAPDAEHFLGLCALWSEGLRTLRAHLQAGGGVWGVDFGDGDGVPDTSVSDAAVLARRDRGLGGGGAEGVGGGGDEGSKGAATRDVQGRDPPMAVFAQGLALMKELRSVEIELGVNSWDNEAKLRWCADLEEMANASRRLQGLRIVTVVCVSKITK